MYNVRGKDIFFPFYLKLLKQMLIYYNWVSFPLQLPGLHLTMLCMGLRQPGYIGKIMRTSLSLKLKIVFLIWSDSNDKYHLISQGFFTGTLEDFSKAGN